jgi:hypothetical protein
MAAGFNVIFIRKSETYKSRPARGANRILLACTRVPLVCWSNIEANRAYFH